MPELTIYMGYDSRELEAFAVARHSILSRTKADVNIVPLRLDRPPVLGLLNRPIEHRDGKMWCPISEAPMSTQFAISRFVVPFVQRRGWALFLDCDIVCLADIAELFALADDRYAVMCVKHAQQVKPGETKMDDQAQTFYARKNWSSLVLWNCEHPAHQCFTLNDLNYWPGRDLHAFEWLKDDEIGELPRAWNHLVDVPLDPKDPDSEPPKIAHYTLGGPWLPGWPRRQSDWVWLDEARSMGM